MSISVADSLPVEHPAFKKPHPSRTITSVGQSTEDTTTIGEHVSEGKDVAFTGSASSGSSESESTAEKVSESEPQDSGSEAAASESPEGQSASHSQAAYNPETGEINWDCPCLGGMAHGPCGAEFRDAFSCFVHSEDEPKGINCVEKFKAMQSCFREHPDIYGEGQIILRFLYIS
jgi:hypothetical protein